VPIHVPHHILRFRNVTVLHGRTLALEDINLDIPCGSSTALLGPNGAGKSTLLRSILGWHRLASGEILLGDAHPNHQLPRLAYLPQRQSIDWDFPITVRAVVEQGRYPSLRFFQRLSSQDQQRVDRALDELGLNALAQRQISQLSGGQQQRVFLARALAQGAEVFLLDEPFAGLDLLACEELCHLLRNWVMHGRTVVAAVHDLALARESFGRGVLLDTALIATGPIAEVLSPENIDRAFRRGRTARENPLHLARTTEFPS
jgi:ABC-type Mn2+/Zn2+ transport system ATPase subunit